LALLERHKPLLRFDRQYDYRAAAVTGIVENAGNLLRRADGEVIARVGGEPALSLGLLSAYPDAREPKSDDCLCAAPDVLGDARRMEGGPRYSGRLYGRVVHDDGGRAWLQYWFWLYLGRLLHRLGERFYPNPPELSTRLDGRRCTVEYRMRNTRGRRSRHLYLTVHDGERVIASRVVRDAGDSGAEILRLPHVPASPEVWGSTFNGVRQRSDLMKATEEG
jgi:hypothetical protein